MYLKKMEMKGFKSFADKTVIDFKSGISCIIGPNGSGKSNITDALRWVLGEQKVSLLRGSSMKDVIFKGSAHRKALGRAEISLYFDNSENFFDLEYDTVKITRRLFRSGESEYLINNTKTLLRDIRELIMDTGIGSDGYSIVSQGKINSMITANKQDMRSIFEEAAGITKFKTRKKNSEKKLLKTTSNLERIEDIVNELEKRVKPLKEESEKAIKYKKLYDKLKKMEVASFANKIKDSLDEEKLLNKKLTDIYLFKDHKDNYKKILKNNFNDYKEKISLIEKEIALIEESYYQMNDMISSNQNEYNLSEQRISTIEEKLEEESDNLIDLKKDYSKMKGSYKKNEEEKLNLVKEIEENNKLLKNKELELINESDSVKEMISSNDKLNQKIIDLNTKKSKNKVIITSKMENKSEYDEMIKSYKEEMDILNNNNFSYIDKRKDIKIKLDELSEKLLSIKKIYEEKIKSLEKLNEEENFKKNKYNKVNNKLNQNIAEYKLLKNYEKNFKGYYYSVKQLMTSIKNTPLNQGVHGVVASLMNIEQVYEKSIEIALGSSMQNVVCDNPDIAKKLINHLKKNKYGRVSFLPLSNLYKRYEDKNQLNKLLSFENVIGKANNIISFDKKYKELFNYLLGNVIIVKDYDSAKKLLSIKNLKYKIVTLDGEIFSPGGRITGGSYQSKSKGLIGRKRKIEKLEKQIERKKEEINSFSSELAQMENNKISISKEIDNFRNKIENIKESGFELKSKLNYLDEKLKDYDEQKNNKKNQIDLLESKIKKIENENKNLKSVNDKITSEINLLKKKLKEKNVLKNKEEYVELISNQVNEFKVKMATLNEKYEGYKNKISNINMKIEDLEYTIKSKEELIKQYKINLLNKKKENKEFLVKIEEIKKRKISIGESLNYKKRLLSETEKKLYSTEKQLEKNNDILESVSKKISSYRIKKVKIDTILENIKKDLWQKYEMSYLDAISDEYENINIMNSEEKLKTLRKEIRKIGNVNLNSIEEYKHVKERYDELSEQVKDLIKGKKSLESIIRKLEKKMKAQFLEELTSIREYFKETFKRLFNGGKSDIILDDADDILESDITIMAQPPGKKLQSLDLLSGGEKALTAISLLFAILKNKPTPFCILDEIEAALDDVNVFRFADYLKEIVNDSQFIVITHRKGTMEVADCLYGVTMEEKGVSKIVSLKLEDIDVEEL